MSEASIRESNRNKWKVYCSKKCRSLKPTVCCYVCKKEFVRSLAEVKRNEKRGAKNFCSQECAGKLLVSNFHGKRGDGSQLVANNRHDEFSPFRNHLKNIQHHCRDKGNMDWFKITLSDLKMQWDKQNGICPYTGWKLINPHSSAERPARTPDRASVDRIDSSRGYEPDNIQFICLIAQYAKNGWSESVLLEFAQAIVDKKSIALQATSFVV